jgi:hypothetical protein
MFTMMRVLSEPGCVSTLTVSVAQVDERWRPFLVLGV